MINKNKIFKYAIIASYSILILLFIISDVENYVNYSDDFNCSYSKKCIHICPNNKNFSDEKLKKAIEEIIEFENYYDDSEDEKDLKIALNILELKCLNDFHIVVAHKIQNFPFSYVRNYDAVQKKF